MIWSLGLSVLSSRPTKAKRRHLNEAADAGAKTGSIVAASPPMKLLRPATAGEGRLCERYCGKLANDRRRHRLAPRFTSQPLARILAQEEAAFSAASFALASALAAVRAARSECHAAVIWRGNCHPGELGTVLRKLGFTRQRRWHDEGGFCALWYPTEKLNK